MPARLLGRGELRAGKNRAGREAAFHGGEAGGGGRRPVRAGRYVRPAVRFVRTQDRAGSADEGRPRLAGAQRIKIRKLYIFH